MSVLSVANIITEVRSRVGDDNSSSYFLTDTQWTSMINGVLRQLPKYCMAQDVETITGTGADNYAVPSGAQNKNWVGLYKRYNDDAQTDIPLTNYRVHENVIYLQDYLSSNEKVIIWFKKPYAAGDDFPDNVAEMVYLMCELAFLRHGIHRRADFEQWAALSRSDASINMMVTASREIRDQISELANALSDGPEIYNLGLYE